MFLGGGGWAYLLLAVPVVLWFRLAGGVAGMARGAPVAVGVGLLGGWGGQVRAWMWW